MNMKSGNSLKKMTKGCLPDENLILAAIWESRLLCKDNNARLGQKIQ